jgi:GntR family transcriptional regulator
MPSERNLSELLGISRVTARKALEVLLDQGLIRRNARFRHLHHAPS